MTTADRLATFCGIKIVGHTLSWPDERLPLTADECVRGVVWWTASDTLCVFDPAHDRNHLALVLEACREKGMLVTVERAIWECYTGEERDIFARYCLWLLTLDPATICQAVVAVMDEEAKRGREEVNP